MCFNREGGGGWESIFQVTFPDYDRGLRLTPVPNSVSPSSLLPEFNFSVLCLLEGFIRLSDSHLDSTNLDPSPTPSMKVVREHSSTLSRPLDLDDGFF